MTVVENTATVEVVTGPASGVDAELIVLPLFEGEPPDEGHPLAAAAGLKVWPALGKDEKGLVRHAARKVGDRS